MPRLIEIALILELFGLIAAVPCLLNTTPISMTLFFTLGIPLLGAGFLIYAWEVIRDLRHHQVL